MTKLPCEVIRDLLPLYLDGVCSPASAALVLMNTENFGSPTGDTWQFVVSLFIFGAVLAANFFFKVNAILLIVLAGVAGFLIY